MPTARALGPLALAAFAIAALAIGRDLPIWSFDGPGSGLLPLIAAAILLAMSGLVWLGKAPAADDDGPGDNRRVMFYVVGLIVLAPAILVIGMLPALGLFVLVMLRFVEGTRWSMAAGVAVAGSALCWLLFVRLLAVPLPGPQWIF